MTNGKSFESFSRQAIENTAYEFMIVGESLKFSYRKLRVGGTSLTEPSTFLNQLANIIILLAIELNLWSS